MKKAMKIFGIIVVVGIVTAVYVWFFIYNKPHRDYEKATADFTMTASSCYQQYANGSNEASDLTGKVLKIEGVPSSIENNDSTVVIVFAFNEGMFGDEGIRCSMLSKYHTESTRINLTENISIKGYCTGYNGTDVILEHCSLLTQ